MSWWTIVVNIVLGFILLGKGAEWLVGVSTVLARRMGVSAMVVGLTVVAWGTSLPEVVVSVGAALDSSAALSLGNVLAATLRTSAWCWARARSFCRRCSKAASPGARSFGFCSRSSF